MFYGNARGHPELEYLDDRKSLLVTENSTQKKDIRDISIQRSFFFFTYLKRIWLQSVHTWFEILTWRLGSDWLYENIPIHFPFL